MFSHDWPSLIALGLIVLTIVVFAAVTALLLLGS